MLAGKEGGQQPLQGLAQLPSLQFLQKPRQITEFTPSFESTFKPTSCSTADTKPSRSCPLSQDFLLVPRQVSAHARLGPREGAPHAPPGPVCCRELWDHTCVSEQACRNAALFAEESP